MPTVAKDGMRGLAVFISDIRNCKSKEAETKRINKELANIRSKFKGDKTLDGYHKKKYVCKLLFIFLLGHDVDFGHIEAVNLLSSNKYTEKQIGYLFISVLLNDGNDLVNLIIQNIKNDLSSRNPIHVNLALHCIANVGTREMAEAFFNEIPKLLISKEDIDQVKQSAALCMLRLYRAAPDLLPNGDWQNRVVHLLNDSHLGVVTAASSLIHALAEGNPEAYSSAVGFAVNRLSRIVTSTYQDLQDYTYYFVPAPWLSCKLLRLLQLFPPPSEQARLIECLEVILNKAQEPPKSKKIQHSNAKNSVLLEAINLIIHLDNDAVCPLLVRATNQLGQFLNHRETNLRYLALESLAQLAQCDFSREAVKKHLDTVIQALKTERDVSVRQRAVDLLYAMCDRSNAERIVQEMLAYLEAADYSIREEMVLKTAILSEKYATDYNWYVDVILQLIRVAGDYVSEEVWHRVIQVVTNREDIQGYAAKTCFDALQQPACHENMVKVGGYILGEFGNLIAGDQRSAPLIQFQLLQTRFHLCSSTTRSLILSAYIKMINLFPEIKTEIEDVLRSDVLQKNSDIELQQRALEYFKLSAISASNTEMLATVLEEMPPFPERESSILAKLKKKKPAAAKVIESPTNEDKAKSLPVAKMSNDPPIPQAAPQQSSQDLLVDIFATPNTAPAPAAPSADPSYGMTNTAPAAAAPSEPPPLIDSHCQKFFLKNSGVLYEDENLQIGIKMEFRERLGRIQLFYGNKSSSVDISSFKADVGSIEGLNISTHQEAPNTITVGSQFQHIVNAETTKDFALFPILSISGIYGGQHLSLRIALPVYMTKFSATATMDANQFFQRWRGLEKPDQQSQAVFKTTSINREAASGILSSCGLTVLEGVDPNKENHVAAGILHSVTTIGVLLRLEPNAPSSMYRLTIRSSVPAASENICRLLQSHLQ
ncbi:unnamed protein product [Oikopleura dioica]|uniref:AP-2 complex subunit alpha n=2 Tax=Oikopleura dioica TaxID=34765 RepID=E4Z042_OIKDI|nr:unnamed protein product [Oikopleura dioica]